ncbi:glycosyltransferase [Caulobacter sp. 1776]|uniref:glycosyltransferase n=1 Tax=Caulobacter sp. 1776 TaxID=3156420 RepID=UPI0033954551
MTATQLEQARLDAPPLFASAKGQQATAIPQSNSVLATKSILYVCNTFGQPDHDRCTAIARNGGRVLAIDWSRDDTGYIWEKTEKTFGYREIEVTSNSLISRTTSLINLFTIANSFEFETAIVYGFHNIAFFFLSIYLRAIGKTVITMYDSRFSDYARSLTKDFLKRYMFLPYSACLAASEQAAEYAHYLGLKRIEVYRCAIDTQRIRQISQHSRDNTDFSDRYFLCVSRFVEKKNLAFMLRAYALYAAQSETPRRLELVGYGDLRDEIVQQVGADPNLASRVTIRDYVPASELPNLIGGAIGLVLPSTTDQFGIVVTEALSAGIPAIVSSNCGAAEIVAPWVNGVVINPKSLEDIARAFAFIDCDEAAWNRLSKEAEKSSQAGDVNIFLSALDRLISKGKRSA